MSTNRKTKPASSKAAKPPAKPADELPFDLPLFADEPANNAPENAAGDNDPVVDEAPPFDDLPPVEAYHDVPSQPEQPGGDQPDQLSISQRAMAAGNRPAAAVEYLAGLNDEQRRAIETLEGPVLVLAGAGTGKTRVLTTRIAHILNQARAFPSQILAVTFTNKAAREMKERIGTLVGGAVEGMPWLGTFHSIGVKILRRHAELANLKSGFTILDADDQLRLMKQVIEAEGIDKDRWPARQLAGLIDGWKNRGLTPQKITAGDASAFAGGRARELYAAYQKRLKELNACDFGDLLLETLTILLNNPDILADYHRRFRFILVDEYQDTNVVQYMWLRLLAQGSPNVCCVGDDDQSIYGWRGAEVDNILRFENDFPGATVIRLERNYRSTGHILAAASGLIASNEGRLGKTLFTDDALGDKVTVTGLWDDEEEARNISSEIESQHKSGHAMNEIAVLVRASFQMRVLEDRFVTLGLPYRVIGGPRFYERAEIKDAIAYLDVTLNPSNDLKFERIVNVPKRGIGDTSVRRVRELARAREVPLYQAAREIVETEELTGKARRSLAGVIVNFERWRAQIKSLPHTELAELILDESGYTAMWQADKSPQAQSRLENLKELVRFMDQFENLQGFLEHVSLVMDVDQTNDGDRVSLMTLHAAKGLEFDTVFLSGWEEGLFPHQRSLDESGMAGLEEERRLAYVGLTRAKKNAHISFTQNRRTHGLYQSAQPSRFVDELPEPHIEVIETSSPYGGNASFSGMHNNPYGRSRFDQADTAFQSSYETPGWKRAQAQQKNPEKSGARKSNRGPVTIDGELVASSSSTSSFATGDRVFHQKFGYGHVSAVDGNKLTIDFDKAGQKRVIDSFVERH